MIQCKNSKTVKIIISHLIWFICLYGFCEIYLHITIFHNCFIWLPLILCLPLAVSAAFLCSLFSRRINIVLGGIITFLVCLFCVVELVYYGIFHILLAPFSSLGMAGNAVDFRSVLFGYIEDHVGEIIIGLIPCVIYIVLCLGKVIGSQLPKEVIKKGWGVALMVYLAGLLCMFPAGTELKSPLYTYFRSSQIDMNIETLGVTTGIRLDLERIICSKITGVDSLLYEEDADSSVIYRGNEQAEPNKIDYDFEALIEEADNKKIRSLHEYMQGVEPTYKNDYTGMFEGYNLIFITAEAWWKYAVREDLTPTLYQMLNEGFVFENYYTPLWTGSTIGGEFANLTGLIPKESGQFSMVVTGENENDMRFTLSRMLKEQGYGVRAFHSYYHDFYERNLSHPNMGFEWYAAGNGGYEVETYDNGEMVWPQSDLKLASDTFDVYGNLDSQPFYTNYMSFSGHAGYEPWQAMAARHWNMVEDLPYSDNAKSYLACNYELELAVEYLVECLDEKGMLENTLFVIAPDHIPYGYVDMCSELSGEDLENNLEWYHSSLIIWSASMEKPVDVPKYCSNIDIFPTVANLMGLVYDSRLLAGQDILSDAEQFVIFPDRSWITGKGIYDSNTGEFTAFESEDVAEEYINEVSGIVEKKIQISADIVENDYYAALP